MYKEPKVRVEQKFENQQTGVPAKEFNVCIVGPAYEMVKNEEHTWNYSVPSAPANIPFATSNLPDIRLEDVDELVYPVKVTLKDAIIQRSLNIGSGSMKSGILESTGAFDYNTTAKKSYVIFGDYQTKHMLEKPVSHDTGAHTVTFANPVLIPLYDYNSSGLASYVDAVGTYTVTAISSDRKTITLDSGPSTTDLDGVYTTNTINTSSDKVYFSKIDKNKATLYGLPSTVEFTTINDFSIYEINTIDIGNFITNSSEVIFTGAIETSDGLTVDSCEIALLTYRALKTSLSEQLIRIDISDYANYINDLIGKVDIYNTGAYATYQACLNTTVDVYFTGVDATYFINKTTAYSTAEAFLREHSVYHIVPLSQDYEVHQLFDANVDYCSTRDIGLWRVNWLSHKLKTEESIVTGNTIASEGYEDNLFTDSSANFTSSGVQSGHKLVMESWDDIEPQLIGTDLASSTASGTVIAWNKDYLTLVVTGVSALPAGVSNVSELEGTAVWIDSDSTELASTDREYVDFTHTYGVSGYTFEDLGYRVSKALYDSGSGMLTLKLEASVADNDISGSGTSCDLVFRHSIAPLYVENQLKAGIPIFNVSSATELTFATSYTKAFYKGVEYSIEKTISKDTQATNEGLYCASFADRRTRFVWPDRGYTDEGIELKGYFLAASIAGAYSGMPVQESLTRHNVKTSIYTLDHSNKYFTRSQLNMLADGGVTIMTQTVEGANPVCRQQLSSDMSTIYYREPSITHAIDKVSYKVAYMYDKLIGVYNITPQLFDVATMYFESIKIEMLTPQPRIGSPLAKLDLITMKQDETQPDAVSCEFSAQPQIPCNGFNVVIKVK